MATSDLKSLTIFIFTGRNEVVAKVMFLLVSVILSTGGSPCKETPQEGGTPQKEAPSQQGDPQQGDPWKEAPPVKEAPPPRKEALPQKEAPPGRETPWKEAPPAKETPLGRRPAPGIQSMSGRYASYWNAFLLNVKFESSFTVLNPWKFTRYG